jgi:hypothetical protein
MLRKRRGSLKKKEKKFIRQHSRRPTCVNTRNPAAIKKKTNKRKKIICWDWRMYKSVVNNELVRFVFRRSQWRNKSQKCTLEMTLQPV